MKQVRFSGRRKSPVYSLTFHSGAVIAEVNQNPNLPTYKNNKGKNKVGNTKKKRRRKRTNE